MNKPAKEPRIQTALRFPKELHQALSQAAAMNGRSLNDEVIARLLASQTVPDRLAAIEEGNSEMRAMLREIRSAVTHSS